MNLIKKVFDGEVDSFIHILFQRFSKGEFKNRALIEAKMSANNGATIKTSAEFANEFVNILAGELGEERTKITGAIISTNDLAEEIEFKEKKQFQGVKRYIIDKEMSGKEIKDLIEKFPKTFFALSFEAGDDKLKIKPKAPNSGKSGKKKDEIPKINFCTLKTKNKKIIESFIFEKNNFKNAIVTHKFLINKIEVPENLKNSDDFAKIREESKRCGKIIRNAVIDGEEKISEKEFCA